MTTTAPFPDETESTPLVGPLDALTTSLDQHGYPQSAQSICTWLFLGEFDTTAPFSQSTLAEKTNRDVRTVRTQLAALEADGYVVHHTNPHDPREKLYRLRSLDIE